MNKIIIPIVAVLVGIGVGYYQIYYLPESIKELVPKDKGVTNVPVIEPKPVSRDELYSYALDLVNTDRAKNGLSPVHLSNNRAAQAHADDVLKMRTISHWMTNGEKPYMTYTRYGGTGNVGQNVGFGGYPDISECNKSFVICEPITPLNAIKESHNSMVYDDAASGWGHRDNILDPHHTHVSFGFAYDEYSYAFVQNFEDNYIDFITPISDDPNNVQIVGNVISGQLSNISIYYDQYPDSIQYEIHKNDRSYGVGDLVAIVVPPPPPNSYYDQPTEYSLIIAKSMSQRGNSINVSFDMSSIALSRGVYTITVWLNDGEVDVPVTSYAVLVQ